MSKGNMFQGQASGKVGDTVMMVRNGQQLTRVYTQSGARGGSEASQLTRHQRVAFGAASSEWVLMRQISSGMFRRVKKPTQSDYNFFTKLNQKFLPYLTKQENELRVHYIMPGAITFGTLGKIATDNTYQVQEESPMYRLFLSADGYSLTSNITFASTMAAFKSTLRAAFPSARKITYVLAKVSYDPINIGEESVYTQNVTWHPLIIDLYAEMHSGENSLTVANYISTYSDWTSTFTFSTVSTDVFAASNILATLNFTGTSASSDMYKALIYIVATDDLAQDCYTTTLDPAGFPDNIGPMKPWYVHRTSDALRVAADSYGYKQGTLREEITGIDDVTNNYAAAYRKRANAIIEESKALEMSIKTETSKK